MRTNSTSTGTSSGGLREEAHAQGVSLMEMVNRAIHGASRNVPRPASSTGVRPSRWGAPLRPIDNPLALADALDQNERTNTKLAKRR